MDQTARYKDFSLFETIYDGVVEQPFELDYLLADYCANIYKVLKCIVKPIVTSKRIISGKVIVDLTVNVKILYISEGSPLICSIEQKIAYTKEIDIKGADDNCYLTLNCKCDYNNLRVVNPRRLDLKGAVSIKLSLSSEKKVKILDNIEDKLCQIKKDTINICNKRLMTEKDFNIHEDLELTYGKPTIQSIINYSATPVINEYKLMENKVNVKGNINLHLLYLTADSDVASILEYTIPFSQIIDLPSVDDNYRIYGDASVIAVNFDINTGDSDNSSNLSCNFTMCLNLLALLNTDEEIIDDMYHTDFEAEIACENMKIMAALDNIDYSFISKNTIGLDSAQIGSICDIICDNSFPTVKIMPTGINVSFNILVCVIALDNENMPFVLEKSLPCNITLDNNFNSSDIFFNPNITLLNCTYTLLSSDQIEIRNEIKINGIIYTQKYCCPATSFSVLNDMPKYKNEDVAINIYYANAGENVWDIAKSFSTPINNIIKENNLEDVDCCAIRNKQMLIIPMEY